MYNINPRDLSVYIEKMKNFGEKDSEMKTLKLSEEEYLIFDYITAKFQITNIIDENEEGEENITIGNKTFLDKNFLMDGYQVEKEYKEKYYKEMSYSKNEKIDKVIKTILKNEILLILIILFFMGIGPFIASFLKLEGFIALFFALITPLAGMIVLTTIIKKE